MIPSEAILALEGSILRSLFKGTLGFGLVAIPVSLYKAIDVKAESVEVHLIHRSCGTRVQYQKYCPTCDSRPGTEDLARASPLPDGRWVVLDESEGETDGPPASSERTIAIRSFHALSEIDPVYFHQAYWVQAGSGGAKPYKLLWEAMTEAHEVAVADMTLRQKPQLAVVRPHPTGSLMLHSMHYPESLRLEGTHFGQDLRAVVSDRERRMAEALIGELTEPFDPASYPNHLRRQQEDFIRAHAATARAAVGREHGPDVADLVQELRDSVEQLKKGRGAG